LATPSIDFRVPLHVLVVTEDLATARLVERTLAPGSDVVTAAPDLSDGLAKAAAEIPDVVLVDLTLGNNAGLAIVHHLRALASTAAIYALTHPSTLALGPQALALGASGVLVLPLTGDEILRTISAERTRHAQEAERVHLRKQAVLVDRARAFADALANVAAAASRREACERLVALLSQDHTVQAVLYMPSADGSRQWMRVGRSGKLDTAPGFVAELEIFAWANVNGFEVYRFSLGRRSVCLAVLRAEHRSQMDALKDILLLLGPQIATALSLASEREQSSRGAMKDPRTSAYTFAYFVDVTGREIDKARRYGRRFALATLGLELPAHTEESPAPDPGVQVAERILSSVRDTDVLARVDDGEFYLLLPETGGAGAHICRRRLLREFIGDTTEAADAATAVAVGVATFPHDGLDLSQLLRMARHRADASRRSPVRRLGLNRFSLPEILDSLLWRLDEASEGLAAEAPRLIELPMMDAIPLVTSVIREACRGGETCVVASVHSGMSLGGAVRGYLDPDRDILQVETVDLSAHANCRDLEVLVVFAEHGVYSLFGRSTGHTLKALHSADIMLADLLVQRLADLSRARVVD
jgi:DNA-binding response OmpR family regulator/GGDEF domain-containing protein